MNKWILLLYFAFNNRFPFLNLWFVIVLIDSSKVSIFDETRVRRSRPPRIVKKDLTR